MPEPLVHSLTHSLSLSFNSYNFYCPDSDYIFHKSCDCFGEDEDERLSANNRIQLPFTFAFYSKYLTVSTFRRIPLLNTLCIDT